jgi:integrase
VRGYPGFRWVCDSNDRARSAGEAADLAVVTLHGARHVYAGLSIAAGINIKGRQHYLGRTPVAMTLDRYGHVLPGAEDEAASMSDAFLPTDLDAQAVPHPTREGAQT